MSLYILIWMFCVWTIEWNVNEQRTMKKVWNKNCIKYELEKERREKIQIIEIKKTFCSLNSFYKNFNVHQSIKIM